MWTYSQTESTSLVHTTEQDDVKLKTGWICVSKECSGESGFLAGGEMCERVKI